MSEGTCKNCGPPRRMTKTESSGNQEFGSLIHLVGKGEEEEKEVYMQ